VADGTRLGTMIDEDGLPAPIPDTHRRSPRTVRGRPCPSPHQQSVRPHGRRMRTFSWLPRRNDEHQISLQHVPRIETVELQSPIPSARAAIVFHARRISPDRAISKPALGRPRFLLPRTNISYPIASQEWVVERSRLTTAEFTGRRGIASVSTSRTRLTAAARYASCGG